MKLQPDESLLVGQWIEVDGGVDGDEPCKRIRQLVAECLEQVATSDAGWTRLFVDKNDGRYWELTYPHSEWHGGGPSTLECIPEEQVRKKYKAIEAVE